MKVRSDLLDLQRRALATLVDDNQLPNVTEWELLEGLLELLHSIEDVRFETSGNEVTLEFAEEM